MKSKNRFFIFYLILSTFCLIAGGLFFALYHGYIVIRTTQTNYKKPISPIEKRTINLYFHMHGKPRKEQVSVLWYGNNTQKTIMHIVNRWLRLLEEEKVPYQSVTLQSAITTPTHEAYLSFDRTPFFESSSTAHKLQWIEDLLHTLRKAKTGITAVYFLSGHAPLDDQALDFEIPWKLTGFAQQAKNKKISASNSRSHKKRRMRTIMLRPLDTAVETLAKQIKKLLEQRRTVKVIITPKSYTNQFEAAQAINQKGINYYIVLHSYTARIKKPQIDLYAYASSPTDRLESSYANQPSLKLRQTGASADKENKALSFIPWGQAHLLPLKETNQWCQAVTELTPMIHSLQWCPYKPLKGITTPGLSFELAWYKNIDMQEYADQISQCIKKAFEA